MRLTPASQRPCIRSIRLARLGLGELSRPSQEEEAWMLVPSFRFGRGRHQTFDSYWLKYSTASTLLVFKERVERYCIKKYILHEAVDFLIEGRGKYISSIRGREKQSTLFKSYQLHNKTVDHLNLVVLVDQIAICMADGSVPAFISNINICRLPLIQLSTV